MTVKLEVKFTVKEMKRLRRRFQLVMAAFMIGVLSGDTFFLAARPSLDSVSSKVPSVVISLRVWWFR